MKHPQVIHGLCFSLTSPNLPARKLAAEILVFFCHWEEEGEDRVGLSHVLQGLGHVETHHNSNHPIGQKVGKFDVWLRQMETTVEGRGRMGSTVGLSKDLKGTDDGTILDICVRQALVTPLTPGDDDLLDHGHDLCQRYSSSMLYQVSAGIGRPDEGLSKDQSLA